MLLRSKTQLSDTAEITTHMCIWMLRGEERQNPGDGEITAPPGHSALGTHQSHVLLRGSKE